MGFVYLASGSPRRAELLKQLNIEFEVICPEVDESLLAGELPQDYVCRLAQSKAKVAQHLCEADKKRNYPIVAADTCVVVGGEILGKPENRDAACKMLGKLSGREHSVFTGVAVLLGDVCHVRCQQSQVWFRALENNEIQAYWDSGEPVDKAGAYAIQGLGAMFVSSINGSYSGVMGLPLFETVELLRCFGVSPLEA